MGLLYEKERRAVQDKSMPDVKEADVLKRSGRKGAVHRDDEFDEEWSGIDEIIDEHSAEGELDAEELDDEEA